MASHSASEYVMPLSPEQVIALIRSATDEQKRAMTLSGFAGSKPTLASFDGSTVRLQRRRYYRNPFARSLYLTIQRSVAGTIIRAECKMSAGPKAAIAAWFIIAVIIGLPQAIIGLRQGLAPPALVFVCLVVGGILTLLLSWTLSVPEQRKLVNFCDELFDSNRAHLEAHDSD